MAYEPTVWAAGDVVTSAKLNKIETGIANAGSIFVLHETTEENVYTLDRTWQEIHDAMENDAMVVIFSQTSDGMLLDIVWDAIIDNGLYTVDAQAKTYTASSSTEYPLSSS